MSLIRYLPERILINRTGDLHVPDMTYGLTVTIRIIFRRIELNRDE